ncbi:hypothetical protein GCM10009828_065040 [Actinoplanes couchii]
MGLGAWNVPLAAQKSCQRSSISPAIAAVYRKGGVSVSLIFTISSLSSRLEGTKKPLAQEGVAVPGPRFQRISTAG